MPALKNLAGHQFGRLTVIERAGTASNNEALWRCTCACGNETTVNGYNLRNAITTSCGCARVENSRDMCARHGMTSSPEHASWRAIKARCYNPTNRQYPANGGRGITMDQRWRESFEQFLEDVGPKPSPRHRLFRLDLNDHFRPGNCEWLLPAGRLTRGHF